MRFVTLPVFCFIIILTTGCGSSGVRTDSPAKLSSSSHDPLQKMNKGIYKFNSKFDQILLKPVSRGYDRITPGPIGRGITNFFQNLSEPKVMVNSFLQGKVKRGVTSLSRFLINSTVGLGGLIDWAGMSGAPFEDEDFGQTMAVWGWENGSYVVLPILGPSNVRDSLGIVVDFFSYPLLYYPDAAVRNGMYVLRVVNNRANLLATSDVLSEAAGDKEYEFVREAYKQQRKNLVNEGEVPFEGLEFIEDD